MSLCPAPRTSVPLCLQAFYVFFCMCRHPCAQCSLYPVICSIPTCRQTVLTYSLASACLLLSIDNHLDGLLHSVAILAQDILDQAVTAHHAEAHGGTVVVVPLPTLGKNDGVQSVVRTVQIQSCCLPLQTLPCWVLRCL